MMRTIRCRARCTRGPEVWKIPQRSALGLAGITEIAGLMTTILDPDVATAEELAFVYAERWEI